MMRLLITALSLGLTLGVSGCTTAGELEPVPGSITYGGQPATRLTKAPVGSTVTHRFRDQFNQEWGERYVIQPDRSLRLVSRYRIEYPDD
nr:membrane protein [Rhizobium sp. TCK]